jgi:hypothetical protein
MPQISCDVEILRNGLPLSEKLVPILGTSPTVKFNGSAEVKMTFSGDFLPISANVNVFKDHIRPYLVIDGHRLPMGEYLMTTFPTKTEGGITTMSAECYDLTYLLNREIETRPYWAAGTKYTDIFEQILVAQGITRYRIMASAEVLATDREDWQPGDKWIKLINDLAAEINYRSVRAETDGAVCLSPCTVAAAQNIKHGIETAEDVFDIPNVFIVTVDNADYDMPLRAVSINNDPASSMSILNRGRVPSVKSIDNIANAEALQAYADSLRTKSIIGVRQVNFSVGFDAADAPRGCYDATELTDGGDKYLIEETEWSAELGYRGNYQIAGNEVTYL